MQNLILDFDQSVLAIPNEKRINLHDWQEEIRFACSLRTLEKLQSRLDQDLQLNDYQTALIGSGDYHHISLLLIKNLAKKIAHPFQVIVFDNHPDNMRFPFGIHCGSWISHITKLPFISHVHVVGITSEDIGLAHSWENRLAALYKGKLTYWSMDVNTQWSHKIGLKNAFRSFDDPDQLIQTLIKEQAQTPQPTYLSIDKDVFSTEVVRTNWDQGRLQEKHLMDVITTLKPNLIGSDITGEVSIWHYKNRWKQFMSNLDGQEEISLTDLQSWQIEQNQLNNRILAAINQYSS